MYKKIKLHGTIFVVLSILILIISLGNFSFTLNKNRNNIQNEHGDIITPRKDVHKWLFFEAARYKASGGMDRAKFAKILLPFFELEEGEYK